MTYPSDDESAMELPSWMKVMRFLVLALLCVSILAMAAVGWAAFRLIVEASTPRHDWPERFDLPEGAKPESVSELADGGFIIVYEDHGEWVIIKLAADGTPLKEAHLE